WLEGTGTNLLADPDVQGVVANYRDITAQKQADETHFRLNEELKQRAAELDAAARRQDEALALLDTLLATAPVGLAFVDRAFRYVRINNSLAALDGVPAADHLGREVREVMPQLWPMIEPVLRRVLETGEPLTGVEISGETSAALGPRHWLASYYPV